MRLDSSDTVSIKNWLLTCTEKSHMLRMGNTDTTSQTQQTQTLKLQQLNQHNMNKL